MTTLTVQLPDETYERLRELAQHRGVAVNQLVEELAAASLAEFDAETRFRAMAAKGDSKKAMAILDKLDASSPFAEESSGCTAESRAERLDRFLGAQRNLEEALQGEAPESLGVDPQELKRLEEG